jgi:hypothetical protein
MSDQGYLTNSPSIKQNNEMKKGRRSLPSPTDMDISMLSDMSDDELSLCAEIYYPNEEFSGELETDLNHFFQSEPVGLIKQENVSNLYPKNFASRNDKNVKCI